MKTTRIIVLSIFFLLTHNYLIGQDKKKDVNRDTYQWRYDLECYGGTAKKGFKMVKVWSYAKDQMLATQQAGKNAIHGIIFKGFAGHQGVCREASPMMNKELTEKEYKKFFKEFFADGGDYNRFVSVVADYKGAVDVQRLVQNKRGRRKNKFSLYKVGVVVTVSTDELRKYLEKKKIIHALTRGF